jgi:hypothetical protein
MNKAFLIFYFYEKKKFSLYYKNLRHPCYKFFFLQLIFIKSNDFSLFSFFLQNFYHSLNFQDNILLEIKRTFYKKEILIFCKEIFWIYFISKRFKNFSLWYHVNWLNKKECFHKYEFSDFFFLQYLLFDPKNFHIWNYFFETLVFNKIFVWKKIVFSEILDFLDKKNNSNWNLKNLFYLFNLKLSKNFSKFFFFGKKFQLSTMINMLTILLFNLKILNGMIAFYLIMYLFF